MVRMEMPTGAYASSVTGGESAPICFYKRIGCAAILSPLVDGSDFCLEKQSHIFAPTASFSKRGVYPLKKICCRAWASASNIPATPYVLLNDENRAKVCTQAALPFGVRLSISPYAGAKKRYAS